MSTSSTPRHPLDQDLLVGISAGGVDFAFEVSEQSASTNVDAVLRAREGAAEGTVVVTEHQTAGRGRLDRSWESPAHAALTFSVILRPSERGIPMDRWPWLPLMTGLAVTRALRNHGFNAGVKWPNDVLIDDLKVCGILVELVDTPSGHAAVIGIGINTSLDDSELPTATSTSLRIKSSERVDRTRVLSDVVTSLGEAYHEWREQPADQLDAYRHLSATLGQQVRAELPGGGTSEGRALAVDDIGRLVIATSTGETVVGAGDVIHLRAI